MYKPFIRRSIRFSLACCGAALALGTSAHAQQAQDRAAPAIISRTCAACHAPDGTDSWSRISHERKTPEGWLMTIARMQTMHGLVISDADRRTLVKYLADRQGLAPSETARERYALERRLNTQEDVASAQFMQMCARCHSAARPLLQRRPVEEWQRLVNFHLGQWPSIEYSSMGRDRDWLNIALNEVAPQLAKQYPYDSNAWTDWQAHRPAAATFVGQWRFSGHMPGQGDVYGTMRVSGGGDTFSVALDGHYANGSAFGGSGTAVLYDGYEWRANLDVNGVKLRQVLAANRGEMTGRMFETDHDERGFDFSAAKAGSAGGARILAVQPQYVKAGAEADVTVVGANLSGTPDFGPGVKVTVLARSADALHVHVKAAPGSAAGPRTVSAGGAKFAGFAVYRRIDAVKIAPDYAVARIGGNGGPEPKVEGRFDAIAWGKTAAGKAFRIGAVPAQWSVEPFDDDAKRDNDVKFAGVIDARTGVFTPGDAGPNPARKRSTNNAGNLNVVATVQDAARTVTGRAHLIVGVQRWNNPPIP